MLSSARRSSRRSVVPVALLSLAALLLARCGRVQPSLPAPTPWGSPLPHSMKGYEWRHVLMTGTNRLKGYDEIISPANEVTPEGLVALSVVGTEELRALLGQLPIGEEVFWIGKDWLRQVGADTEMTETLRLPEPTTIAEVEQFCQEAGVNLHVDGAAD